MTTVNKFANLALEGKTIDANCRSIKLHLTKGYDLVHRTAVAIIVASLPRSEGGHENCAQLSKLLAAMPDATRKNALVAWFAHFSNIRVNGDGKVGLLKPEQRGYKVADPIGANSTPYWKLTPEPAVAGPLTDVELDRMLAAIFKRVADAKNEGRLALTPKTLASLGTVERMANELHTRAEGMKAQAKAKPAGTAPKASAKVATKRVGPRMTKSAQKEAAAAAQHLAG